MLTKPSLSKGAVLSFTLNRANVLSLMTGDYADPTKVLAIILHYKSRIGSQITMIPFDGKVSSPTGTTIFPADARDNFDLSKIEIQYAMNEVKLLTRSQLSAPTLLELDLSFGGATGGGASGSRAFQVYRIKMLEAFAQSGSPSLSSSVSLTELQFKYDDVDQSLVGKTMFAILGGGNVSNSQLTNGIIPTNNTGYVNGNIAAGYEITVDLGSRKVLQDIIMGPQGDVTCYNMPKKFEVYGADYLNGTYTLIDTVNVAVEAWIAGQMTRVTVNSLPNFSGPITARYVGIFVNSDDRTFGNSLVIEELQIIEGGVAKTITAAGATLSSLQNFTSGGNISTGDFSKNAGGYVFGSINPQTIVIDLGSVRSIDGLAMSVGGFSSLGPDGMEYVPKSISVIKHDTNFNGSTMTPIFTKTFNRSDWVAGTRKDLLP